MVDKARAEKIAQLNDKARRTYAYCPIVATSGIRSHGDAFMAKAVEGMRQFSDFNRDNDPWHERDFGAYIVDDIRLFFKIEYYAKGDLEHGSEDPADETKTTRVITIMLPEEW